MVCWNGMREAKEKASLGQQKGQFAVLRRGWVSLPDKVRFERRLEGEAANQGPTSAGRVLRVNGTARAKSPRRGRAWHG